MGGRKLLSHPAPRGHAPASGVCRKVFPKGSCLGLPWAALPGGGTSLQSRAEHGAHPCSWRLAKAGPDETRMLPPDR